ncbi:prevent-host-death protein [Marinitoga sp. 1197]|uniref:type II toxin-antitoxin system Phd/YefM family antitoxin n=1 Tax=unclassified Marinitoga TaxID=2640159 RepID=UPI000640C0E7|nr:MULTISPECIES: type II toxin-antitoxin system Phd/YefM family antitoxin [unclassified Marinitoga]KLO20812.1 prevent-host-death protein [Marinitoga sp. 1197]KLO24544.1 prevent-host-death protein [Marinitoga sp. 1155]NUU99405.1 prevent-host-death protein [Marinitoga sp. 1154]
MDIENLKFYSIAEAKAKFSKAAEESKKNFVVITKNGKPEFVLIDFERFKKLMNFIDEIRDLYLMEIGEPGKYNEIKDLFKEIESLDE